MFARSLGADVAPGTIARATVPAGPIPLYLGWVTGHVGPALKPGPRFDRAVAFARALHAGQRRKGTDIPYVAHLLGVASLVVEDGGSEDEAIAGLLHDAVEDQGGAPTLRRIEQLFGREVARIVDACSDADVVPKPPWRARKEAYIAHLPDADRAVLRVSLADKLHNARAILFDLHAGHDVWSRFNADRDAILRYYRALVEAFVARDAGPMAHELERAVESIERQRPAAETQAEAPSAEDPGPAPTAVPADAWWPRIPEPDNTTAEQLARVARSLAQGDTETAERELAPSRASPAAPTRSSRCRPCLARVGPRRRMARPGTRRRPPSPWSTSATA